jgi:hypothetical protein
MCSGNRGWTAGRGLTGRGPRVPVRHDCKPFRRGVRRRRAGKHRRESIGSVGRQRGEQPRPSGLGQRRSVHAAALRHVPCDEPERVAVRSILGRHTRSTPAVRRGFNGRVADSRIHDAAANLGGEQNVYPGRQSNMEHKLPRVGRLDVAGRDETRQVRQCRLRCQFRRIAARRAAV